MMTSSEVASKASADGDSAGYVDWGFAKETGRRLVSAGPQVTASQAAEVVAALRSAAERSRAPVAETARMHSPAGSRHVLIVDRPGWVEANVDSLQSMLEPVIAAMLAKRRAAAKPVRGIGGDSLGSHLVKDVGSKVSGAEVGALLSFFASKILGQYDLAPDGTPRLLLVAPNVLHTEKELGVDPSDFRLWVCLHEETHRVQFTAVPWLRSYFAAEVGRFLSLAQVASASGEQRSALLERLPDVLREIRSSGADSLAVVELLQGPEQRAVLDRLLALTTLLEGHADHVMDAAGPEVVPSVATIRAKFTMRRRGGGLIDRILRALLGVEAKVRQYAVGSAFTSHVVLAAGMDGFNRVWDRPENLPTRAELAEPGAWLRRVEP